MANRFIGDISLAERRTIAATAKNPDTPMPENEDLGVIPMPPPGNAGVPAYMKSAAPVAAQPAYMKSAMPVPELPDPALVAHASADVDSKSADQTIDASQKTGLALGYIAGGLDKSRAALEKQKFAFMLTGRPGLLAWAGQSAQHAALVRPDAEPLGKMEGWFSGWGDALWAGLRDIGSAEAMREYMSYSLDKSRAASPDYVEAKVREYAAGGRDPHDVEAFRQSLQNPSMGPLGGQALDLEAASRQYDQQDHGYPQAILRATPQMAMYVAASRIGGPVGVAALLYAQNKGVLARQIQQAKPDLNPEEVDQYATAGSAVGAVTLAGFLGPLLRSLPGAKPALQGAVGSALARGAATTVGQAALRGLLGYGQHTLMGAMGMALQHGINTAALQKSTTGEMDFEQLARETGSTFLKVLPVAATFAAYGPTRELLAERGRLNAAPLERARLDAQIALSKQMEMTKTFPDRALELFGALGRGAKVFINWEAAEKMTGLPPHDVAAAVAAKDSVAVPAADYLVRLADQHESIKDDVKLSADGVTMNEARARDKELRKALPADVADAVLGKQTPDDILNFEQPKKEGAEEVPPQVENTPTPYKVVKRDGTLTSSTGFDPQYVTTTHTNGSSLKSTDNVFQEPESKISVQTYDYPDYKQRQERLLGFESAPDANEAELQAKWGKQGRGRAVYMAALEDTAKAGYSWTSDSKRTPAANAMYESLIKSGVPLKLEKGSYRASAEALAEYFRSRRPGPPPPPQSEDVTLYRGTKGRDPSVPGMSGARFMTPDQSLAELYASGSIFAKPAEGVGVVSTEKMHFDNVLQGKSWEHIKEQLGLDPLKPAGMEEVLNLARDKGHDALRFESVKGTEYVDLMNWLHELVNQYGGTVKEWREKLTPELVAALKEEGSKGAIAPEEHAARVIEAMPTGDIDPARFERLAKKSQKYIEEAAQKARSGSAAGAKASSPRDVAILSTYELARDLNRAKAARATEVRAEVDKITNDLKAQSGNDKLRALLNKAGSPLLNLFDALTDSTGSVSAKNTLDPNRRGWMAAHQEAVDAGAQAFSPEAVDFANARMRDSLIEAKQWFTDSARPMQFDERVIENFLMHPKPISELLPAEVRTIGDVVKQLTTAAREENVIRAKDTQATVAEVTGEIRGELRQNPSKGLPLPSGVPSGFWRNRLLDANAANAIQLRTKNNLRQKSTAAVKWIFDRINQAVYERDRLYREVRKQWDAAFESLPTERQFETYDLSDKLPVQGMEPLTNVPRQYLYKLARHRMSQGNMERVLSTSGWDSAVVDDILFNDPKTKLTVPEWDSLQALADVNEKYVWPKLKEHFEKFYGVAPPKTAGVPFKVELPDGTFKDYAGGYEPLKRDARPGVAPQAEPTKGIAQYWGRDFQIPWTPGSAKERVDNSHYLVNMDWESSRATLSKALHWLAFDQPVRDVAKLLNDPGLAADMNEYMGQGRADMTRGWLKSSATQNAQSVPEGMEIVARGFGWQRRLQLMQIVGGSARLAVAQLSHPIGLMLGGEVSAVHGIPALLSTFKPMTMADGEVRLFPNWNDAILHGQEVQHRADYAYGALRKSWDKFGPEKPGPLGALKNIALGTAGLYLHAVDRLTTSWAWTAFHNEAVAKFKMEPFSKEAIDYADGKTQDVMPVHDVETAAPILTNRQMGGFLIMHGFKNTLYNMRQDALAKSVKDFNKADTAQQYGGAIARTAGRVALQTAMFGGFAIMGKMALGYGQQDDETKGEWMARDAIGGQSVDIPLIGGLGEPLAKLMLGKTVTRRDFSAYGNPGVAAVAKVQEMLGNLVNGGREDYKKVFDGLEATLFLSGVPSRPIRTTAEHVYEMLMGEGYDSADSSKGDAAGRMFYTDKQWESVKRSLTPDED